MQTIKTRRSWIYLAIFALMLTFAWAPAQAFGPSQERMTAHIPFDFMVQGEKMDAGDYVIWAEEGDDPRIMYIEEKGNHDSVAFLTMQVPNTWDWDEERQAHVGFEQVDGTVFLDSVYVPAHSTARRVPDSDKQDRLEAGSEREKKTIVLESTDKAAK